MNATYDDLNGKVWRFTVNGTPYQLLLFRKVLNALRRAVRAEQLTLSYLADVESNDAFVAEVEAAALSGLAARYPDTSQPPPPPTSPPQPVEAAPRKPYYYVEY